jgi:hypothetical protein
MAVRIFRTCVLLWMAGSAAGCAGSGALSASTILQEPRRVQQGVEYRIEASLDEGSDVLSGRARLRYTNHSAVTLDTIWFHHHLNAFRPNSAWARRELQFGIRRFQDLRPDEHAFERLSRVAVGGTLTQPVYPGAPDSTVVGVPLPEPLRPGQTAILDLDWTGRLATVPRRQGRRGRHFDFAQWYPRVAAFDGARWHVQPLLPQGEFFGEFGSYDVTLDVLADQVIGSTGVPVEGDPGWRQRPAGGGVETRYLRDHYPPREAEALGLLPGATAAGRKRVRWRAEDVHHFGWSANPDFIYEAGTVARSGPDGGEIPIHVLYPPTDAEWGNGVVVERTRSAMEWIQRMFGPYPWPQLTNLRRIEPGGTEFPMLLMNGSPSEGLIVHEVTHQYLHGILANNEFAEGWMDEGFTAFMDIWYQEDHGRHGGWRADMDTIRSWDRTGRSRPIAMPGADFPDMMTYQRMTYTKTALVFRMLRDLVGDETMRRILREYYARHAFQHVTEADFRAVAADVTRRDLDWFFDQWLHTTHTLDFGIHAASTERLPDGRWRTRVEVAREGEAWMPVTLQVGDTRALLDSRERLQVAEVITSDRPAEVLLDPDDILIDTDPANNRRSL